MSDLFIHATVGEHLSCFDCHHNAVTSVLGTYSLVLCACISPGFASKGGIAGSKDAHVFTFTSTSKCTSK